MDTFYTKNGKVKYNGIKYDFDKLPENVVFDGNINISCKKLSRLPNLSTWITKGYFHCYCNKLTSLEGCPKEVGGCFYCNHNKLTSLKGCPREVGGCFYFYDNNIEIIDAWPEYIGGGSYFLHNPIKSIKEGAMPLKYLIHFYEQNLYNSKELLMKEFGVDSEDELNAYLLMMEKI